MDKVSIISLNPTTNERAKLCLFCFLSISLSLFHPPLLRHSSKHTVLRHIKCITSQTNTEKRRLKASKTNFYCCTMCVCVCLSVYSKSGSKNGCNECECFSTPNAILHSIAMAMPAYCKGHETKNRENESLVRREMPSST